VRSIRACVLVLAGLSAQLACGDSSSPRLIVLGGAVRDYYTSTGLPDVDVMYVDQGDTLVGRSGIGGSYLFLNLHPNDAAVVTASITGYRTTRNEALVLSMDDVSADLSVIATTDINRQYTTLARTAVAGSAVVFATLFNGSNQPHTGIPLADITLTPMAGGGAVGLGPYVVGAGGDVNASLTSTTEFDGLSRVLFLDVPAGAYTLTVTFTSGTVQTKTVRVDAATDGVTLVRR
jgi:hypothetical protein